MAITSTFLRDIEAEARPIIERQMNDAKIIAGLRDVVAAAGGDWGALKALIKARVEDDNDEAGEGKRVRKIREKADCIVAYDDMLGSNMNEKNFSASQSYAEAKIGGSGSSNGRTPEFDSGNGGSNPSPETIDSETGEITEPENKFQAKASEDNGATGEAMMRPADSMTGEVSRSSVRDECGAATSENGRDSRERPVLNPT